MAEKLNKKDIARKHIHGRILFQLLIFAIVTIVLFSIVTIDMIHESMNLLWVVGSLVVGLGIGILAGRIFAVKWHEDTQKVILTMDKLSILLVVAYIAFRFLSGQLFGEFLPGEELTIVTFSTLGGIMIGRIVGMLRSVITILKEQGKL